MAMQFVTDVFETIIMGISIWMLYEFIRMIGGLINFSGDSTGGTGGGGSGGGSTTADPNKPVKINKVINPEITCDDEEKVITLEGYGFTNPRIKLIAFRNQNHVMGKITQVIPPVPNSDKVLKAKIKINGAKPGDVFDIILANQNDIDVVAIKEKALTIIPGATQTTGDPKITNATNPLRCQSGTIIFTINGENLKYKKIKQIRLNTTEGRSDIIAIVRTDIGASNTTINAEIQFRTRVPQGTLLILSLVEENGITEVCKYHEPIVVISETSQENISITKITYNEIVKRGVDPTTKKHIATIANAVIEGNGFSNFESSSLTMTFIVRNGAGEAIQEGGNIIYHDDKHLVIPQIRLINADEGDIFIGTLKAENNPVAQGALVITHNTTTTPPESSKITNITPNEIPANKTEETIEIIGSDFKYEEIKKIFFVNQQKDPTKITEHSITISHDKKIITVHVNINNIIVGEVYSIFLMNAQNKPLDFKLNAIEIVAPVTTSEDEVKILSIVENEILKVPEEQIITLEGIGFTKELAKSIKNTLKFINQSNGQPNEIICENIKFEDDKTLKVKIKIDQNLVKDKNIYQIKAQNENGSAITVDNQVRLKIIENTIKTKEIQKELIKAGTYITEYINESRYFNKITSEILVTNHNFINTLNAYGAPPKDLQTIMVTKEQWQKATDSANKLKSLSLEVINILEKISSDSEFNLIPANQIEIYGQSLGNIGILIKRTETIRNQFIINYAQGMLP